MSELRFVTISSPSPTEVSAPPRKRRARLTHLSDAEKIERRKVKNREAAQHARDRKRQKMDDLEDIVRVLQEQNNELKKENARLRRTLDENAAINRDLKESWPTRNPATPPQSPPSDEIAALLTPLSDPNVDAELLELSPPLQTEIKTESQSDESAVLQNVSPQQKSTRFRFSPATVATYLQSLIATSVILSTSSCLVSKATTATTTTVAKEQGVGVAPSLEKVNSFKEKLSPMMLEDLLPAG
ncbi:X-box-binding protein 1-like [Oscarella lobularis]|uniref:X-box-binding protein 1-like n=1 Tax=Oscarella lobularis TaxID=121494 RepID=UPI003313D361